MPGGDRTGPRGFGPMTGRRAGDCAGQDMPWMDNQAPGYRTRFGNRGGGRGWRHRFYATGQPGWARVDVSTPPEQELATLKEHAELLREQTELLREQLEQIGKRIEGLENKQL
jgi:hypothetical protein